MKRFVKHFYRDWDAPSLDVQINQYAEKNNLTIINIAPCYQDGIYVLYEEKEQMVIREELNALEKENERLRHILDLYALQYGTIQDHGSDIEEDT